VKHLLYAYRVLLSGTHLMRTGEVEANLDSLNELFRLPIVDELVDRKRRGAEKMALLPEELETHDRVLDELELELERAHEQSRLPEEPTSRAALDDFVVRVRLASA
jgi:predicted nucleotidyltransferase